MKFRIILSFFFFIAIQNIFSQQFYIRGKVIDGENDQPLRGASVYINNTTKGSVTDENGNFEIGNLQKGQYDVVASFVGYESILYTAKLTTANLHINFKLERKVTTIREVLILTDETRKHYLDILKKNILGFNDAAERCTIKNIEEVQFASGKNKDEVYAYTEKELQIENPLLGYTIYFELIDYYYNKATYASYFLGYTRYVDWGTNEKTKRKWVRKRRQAYEGSTIHFFRSLLNKQLTNEGFTVYQLIPIEKSNNNNSIRVETNNTNTTVVQSMKIGNRIVEDSMFRFYPDSLNRIYELIINNGWRINFAKNTDLKVELVRRNLLRDQPNSGTFSGLRLREEPVLLSERGILLTPLHVFYDGIWGYERLANMLPEDYEVE
jgi:hypothetical protein